MGPIQVVVEDGNNLVLEVTPTPNTTVILDRGIAGPPGPAGSGDLDGPASSTDNAVARFDGATGKLIQNSVVTINDAGNVAGVTNLSLSGSVTLSGGTANGVTYLNGSKVLTTGSGLVFTGSNLGIGSSSPQGVLDLGDATGGRALTWGGLIGNGRHNSIFSSYSGAALVLARGFYGATTTADTYISSITATIANSGIRLNNSAGGIVFFADAAAAQTAGVAFVPSERMRLDASGNLGIGTSSPGAKLDVSGTGRATKLIAGATNGLGLSTTFEVYNAGYVNLAAFRSVPNDGVNPYFLITSSASGITLEENGTAYGALMFKTGGSERMRLDASGNLGIGTSSPGYKMTVAGTGGSATVNLLETGVRSWGIRAGGAATNTFDIADFTAGATRLTIDSSGNLGIGTVSPQAKLDVAGDYKEGVVTANTGTAYTISLATGTVQILTLTGNCTFTFPTATAGKGFTLLLKQDATGSRTVTWPAAVKWPGGTAPTVTATASKLDKYVFVADGTNWYGSNAGQNYTV